ncbi:NUDIX hydrolase [Nocardia stercoris]|uniref:NUDIX hydrolase n=1 Tax=Nocardia stercoris TaxID=2483361 RepID=A0A3M2LDA6_9NOCA|nr:bifunctional NUDIX hydrolase/histidine phosphatase family protein [Nocardia stercoris]RMI35509.1 NUDIX hydrolase [Nocardia stercoris]
MTRSEAAVTVIRAAGAVLWRHGAGGALEIAVVHRPKYNDWSLPKGKLDPGETSMVAAAREVTEETGLHCRLGRFLGHVTYPITGHRKLKRVDYWAAWVCDGKFEPNSEVDVLRWVPVDRVMDALSYPMDRQIVRTFLRLPADTATLIVVRHAKAGRRGQFAGPDDERPLDKAGRGQAAALVAPLSTFGPARVFSAPPLRCVQTVEPLAAEIGSGIELEPLLSETGYALHAEQALDRARELVSGTEVRVLCSQGKVIPFLLQSWAEIDGLALPPARNRKGSFWVLSVHEGRLVAADHVDRLLRVE